MSIPLQRQIKQNAEDIREYIDDLYSWEAEIGKKDKSSTTQNKKPAPEPKDQYPIRGQAKEKPVEENIKNAGPNFKKEDMIRDINSIPSYYKAWDSYATKIDEELEKGESESGIEKEKEKPVKDPRDMMKRTSGAAINTKILIKGGRSAAPDIESLKDKGNLFFKTMEYEKAIDIYTEAIKIATSREIPPELLATLYSNRAMTYMKMDEYLKTEDDCTNALKAVPDHVKSLVRRSKARRRLLKFKAALEDAERADEVQQNDKDILEELKILKAKLKSLKEEKLKKMVLPYMQPNQAKVRVTINDVNPDDKAKDQESAEPEKAKKEEIPAKKEAAELISTKNSSEPIQIEEASDFITLKNIEGKPLSHEKHDKSNDQEVVKGSNQKLSFRLDLNTEHIGSTFGKVPLNKAPKKSILKKTSKVAKPSNGSAEQTKDQAEKENKTSRVQKINTERIVSQTIKNMEKDIIENYEKKSVGNLNGNDESKDKAQMTQTVNSSEFTNTWKYIKSNSETGEKYLLSIGVENLPGIFKEGLDMDVFSEFISFAKRIVPSNPELARQLIETLKNVKRFEIFSKSLLKNEKKDLNELISALTEKSLISQQDEEALKKAYKL